MLLAAFCCPENYLKATLNDTIVRDPIKSVNDQRKVWPNLARPTPIINRSVHS